MTRPARTNGNKDDRDDGDDNIYRNSNRRNNYTNANSKFNISNDNNNKKSKYSSSRAKSVPEEGFRAKVSPTAKMQMSMQEKFQEFMNSHRLSPGGSKVKKNVSPFAGTGSKKSPKSSSFAEKMSKDKERNTTIWASKRGAKQKEATGLSPKDSKEASSIIASIKKTKILSTEGKSSAIRRRRSSKGKKDDNNNNNNNNNNVVVDDDDDGFDCGYMREIDLEANGDWLRRGIKPVRQALETTDKVLRQLNQAAANRGI